MNTYSPGLLYKYKRTAKYNLRVLQVVKRIESCLLQMATHERQKKTASRVVLRLYLVNTCSFDDF